MIPTPTETSPHIGLAYSVAVVAGCLGPFVVVRCGRGPLSAVFPPSRRARVTHAVAAMYGELLPVVYLAREANGYRFEAPADIAEDVGLVMEDLSCRDVAWHDLPLDEAAAEPAPRAA